MHKFFLSKTAQLEQKIEEWQEAAPHLIRIDSELSYSGHDVYAISLSRFDKSLAGKPAHYFAQPHAHEPSATAGMMDVIEQLLSGKDLLGNPSLLDRERILAHSILTFNPIGNPQGRDRAPVHYWDGTDYSNEQLWCSMRGEDPQNPGQMWKRLNIWDDREVQAPKPVGIVYEQIDEHRWVEPNRSRLSTYFKLFFKMDARYHYRAWLDLHQTEYVDSDNNCEILLAIDEMQPETIRAYNQSWGQAIVDAWLAKGYKPYPQPHPLPYTGEQAMYFKETWGDLHQRMHIINTEVKNNALDASPEFQMKAQSLAIEKSIEVFLARNGEVKC